MEEEGFHEDLVSLYNLDDWDDSSSSFYDWDYSPPQQVLLNETSIVGFAMASVIVSSGYCTVFFNERESVRLVLHRRKPGDQNQNPAIKVLNADNLEVGYLDRSVSTVLSPLIDNKMINAEGVILGSRTRSKKLVACQVCISAKLYDFGTVKTAISQGGLDLVSRPGSSFAPSQEAMVVKEKRSGDGDRSFGRGESEEERTRRFSNHEPFIFHTQEPVIIENQNGVGLAETTLEIEPENINLKHALKVEPAQLNFIPIVRVHAASAAQPVNGSDLNECLDSDSLLAKSDEVEGDSYPTKLLVRDISYDVAARSSGQLVQENEVEMIPNHFY
uniref:HIRAN domain-containing protein n=1 Tax=Salix viminalis TaxID=40686 RepID=A0A6N2NIK8_SALVM